MEPLEVEVKFYIPDISPIRNRILELGAVSTGQVFESNIRFEDENKTLMKKKFLLRLRKDSKTTLTFKSPPPVEDTQFKIHRELEVEVSDFPTMKLILESLGYHKEQTYEKWRETFTLNDTMLCIDKMPYGNFLEIEGKKENIRNLACKIDLRWEERILTNYLAMFCLIRQKSELSFSDVTFDNFKNFDIDFGEYLPFF